MTLRAGRWRAASLGALLMLLVSACGGEAAGGGAGADATTAAEPASEPSEGAAAGDGGAATEDDGATGNGGGATADDDATADDEATEQGAGATASAQVPALDCTETAALELSVPTDPPKFAQLTPVMAIQLGYFEDFCIDATVTGFQTGGAALLAVQAGEVPIGLPSSNAAVVAIGQGSPIVIWGAPASQLPQLILATEDIASCEDLAGRTVATEGPGGLVHFLMTTYLATCGLDIETDVQVFVGAPGDFGPQLAQGVAQASALHVDDEPLIEQTHGIELNVLQSAAELVPNFHYQSFVSQTNFLEDAANREALVNATAAVLLTNRWMVDPANREQMIELAAQVTTRDAAIVEQAYEAYVERFPTTCDETLSQESFEFTTQLQVEAGELPAAAPFEEIVDTSICADAELLIG